MVSESRKSPTWITSSLKTALSAFAQSCLNKPTVSETNHDHWLCQFLSLINFYRRFQHTFHQRTKRCLKKSDGLKKRSIRDTLINYRRAPLANGYFLAELLMGRRIRTKVLIASQNSRAVCIAELGSFK